VSKPAPGERIASITTQRGRSCRRPALSYTTTHRDVAAPLSAHHPRESSPDRFSASLVLADNLVGHVIGRSGRGLKQVADISSARVSIHSQEIDGHWECLVAIRGTDKQLGDALVVLGKQIAQKRVSIPKKKKDGSASSGPGNAGPGPSQQAALPKPSAPQPQSSAHQTTTPTRGRVRPSVTSQTWAPQPLLPPPTPSSRTVAMASPSQPASRTRTPTVPSVHMASPNPTPKTLMPMDVDQIMAVMGRQNSDWPAWQRLELTTHLWNRGVVVQIFDGWKVGETD